MGRFRILVACVALLATWALQAPKASAAVSVSLRIGDPYPGPRLVFVDEPHIVFIPGTRVYYIAYSDYDLYRYGSYWYYYYDGGWYRSVEYDGPFYFISYRSVPRPIRVVPMKYRHHWRSYRGPAYTYYSGGQWYREKPGTAAKSYQRSKAKQPSRDQARKPGKTHERDGGGKGRGKGKGRGHGKGHD